MLNYLPVVMKNAEALKLTGEQKTKLKAWSAANNKKASATVLKIVELEGNIASASMKGDSKKALMSQFTEMSVLRMKLATLKTACRDNVRTILSESQWSQLLEIQGSGFKKAS